MVEKNVVVDAPTRVRRHPTQAERARAPCSRLKGGDLPRDARHPAVGHAGRSRLG